MSIFKKCFLIWISDDPVWLAAGCFLQIDGNMDKVAWVWNKPREKKRSNVIWNCWNRRYILEFKCVVLMKDYHWILFYK